MNNKYMKQKLSELKKKELDIYTIIVEDVNITLSNKTRKYKINKDIKNLKNTMDQIDFT